MRYASISLARRIGYAEICYQPGEAQNGVSDPSYGSRITRVTPICFFRLNFSRTSARAVARPIAGDAPCPRPWKGNPSPRNSKYEHISPVEHCFVRRFTGNCGIRGKSLIWRPPVKATSAVGSGAFFTRIASVAGYANAAWTARLPNT